MEKARPRVEGLRDLVSSLTGPVLLGLFGIAVQNGLGRVRPKLMTAGTAILGLLPLLVLNLHGSEIERPLAVAAARLERPVRHGN